MRIKPGKQVVGVNAGLVLLATGNAVFKKMERELAEGIIKGCPFKSPDQDYLSSFFAEWYCFDVSYNYQLHQLGTKLRAIDLTQYKKVMLIDTDTLVVRSLDNLFDGRTPAALRRHPHGKYLHGEVIRKKSMRIKPGKQV